MHETSDLVRRFAALAAMGFESTGQESGTREVESVDRHVWRVVHRRPAMGTLVSVTALARSTGGIDEAVGEAFGEMDRLIGIFTHFESNSAVSQLNETGRLDRPPRELVRVVTDAVRYHRVTRGGFDISVAPVVELFRQRRGRTLPEVADVRAAMELVGAGQIDVSRTRIGLRRQGMRLTLDGIAKGYIVDAIARVLDSHRIRNYLVEAGGDIRLKGTRGRGRPWRIAVQDPDKRDEFPDTITLAKGAVATSGSYERSFDREEEHHHIVSAETGSSPRYSRSVTVAAPTAMAADALATSVFLMKPEAGVAFVDRLRGCSCLIVGREGRQFRTRRWRSAGPV